MLAMAGHSQGEVLEFSNFVDLLIGKLEAIKQEPGYVDPSLPITPVET